MYHSIIITVFLANVLNKLSTTFSHSIFSKPHIAVSKRKLIYYDDKSQKLVCLLMLAVLTHKVQTVSCLRAVKVETAATSWSPISLP